MSRPAALPEPSAVSDLQLLRLSDAAAVARLSERTLRRALRARQHPLRHHRFGRAVRIAPDDLAAWLRAHAALPVVSTTVLDTLSADAKALIQSLDRPTGSAVQRGDGTAKARHTAPTNNLRPQPPTRLDCGAESSVHVSTDPRSKEEPIPMHDTSTMTRFRAIPARTARGGR
jgi:excisionase family DNA binding protein